MCTVPSTHSELSYRGAALAHFTEYDAECDQNFEFWAGQEYISNTWFVRDTGCYQKVAKIFLRNAHNSWERDRQAYIILDIQ